MTDAEYMHNVITCYKQLDELVALRPLAVYDVEHKILFCSKAYKQVRGDTAKEGGTGLPDESGRYKQSDSIQEQENVIKTKKVHYGVNFNFYGDKVQPYMTIKSPLINKDSNNVTGVQVILQTIVYTNIKFSLLKALEIYELPKNVDLAKYNLTKRERQVVFLFLNGLTSQEIASVIAHAEGKSISKSAIDAVFTNQLRTKFNVFTRDGLYDKLIKLGFYNMIPNDLIVNIKLDADDIKIY